MQKKNILNKWPFAQWKIDAITVSDDGINFRAKPTHSSYMFVCMSILILFQFNCFFLLLNKKPTSNFYKYNTSIFI